MRIVDVSAFYAPRGGGVRAYVDRKLAAAAGLGHEIIVLVPGKTDAVIRRGPGAVLETVASPPFPLDRRYRYFDDEKALHRALDRWRPDFVEASSPWGSASMVARWDGAAPRALVMHADPLSAYAYRWFGQVASIETIDRGFDFFWRHLRRLGEAYDMVVSASGEFAARLSGGGMPGVVTIPMGVEPGIFTPRHRDPRYRAALLAECGLDPSATLLLGIGRHAPEKRWGMVIDAVLSAATQHPIALLLVGEGRLQGRLIARAGGSPHIRIPGPLADRGALARLMASGDALVHGCEAETFCMVAAEARASGLPVIVPDRGGAADHADRAPSLRYRAGDAHALRDAILAFVASHSAAAPRALDEAPRTMDMHFAELFQAYGVLRSAASRAA
ncbi:MULTISPECIES: glycosyltransferase [unclassified Sphingomonas]|jgi:alpha-1,6-mannosyltransferase|uniref:glycosyltransferase n=1 Tax=unclassified Sphingomonas TaxID=196159 RepID=UPI0010F4B65F|nr:MULTISPECIES: glycosyltransferase [unclassified Sphingomonas]